MRHQILLRFGASSIEMLRMLVNHRRHDGGGAPVLAMEEDTESYSPKPSHKHWPRPLDYLLKEQRLMFILVGMAMASFFFYLQPEFTFSQRTSPLDHPHQQDRTLTNLQQDLDTSQHSELMERSTMAMMHNSGAKMPLGLKRKPLRIVVTGGAGFVGSHLVDKLMARGDHVIVVDNLFTGRKENVKHHFGNHRFELIRHDVVEPLLLEVDQIYHLACPASPVHYKHNPVKTIISSLLSVFSIL